MLIKTLGRNTASVYGRNYKISIFAYRRNQMRQNIFGIQIYAPRAIIAMAVVVLVIVFSTQTQASIQTGDQYAISYIATYSNDPSDPPVPYTLFNPVSFTVGAPTSTAGFYNLSSFTLIDGGGICITCETLNLSNVLFDSSNGLLAGTIDGAYTKKGTQRTFDLLVTEAPQATFILTRTGSTPDPVIVSGSYTTSPVPLPAAFWLMGPGILGLFGFKRTKI